MNSERARIKKNDLDTVLIGALKTSGFNVSRSSSKAMWFSKGPLKGWFLWDSDRRAWYVRMDLMTINTYEDLETILGEMAWMAKAIGTVRETWDKYKKTKSDKAWDTYQGAVAALLNKSARPASKTEELERLRRVGA